MNIKDIELLTVGYADRVVGTLSLTPDNHLCTFAFVEVMVAD